VRRHAETCGDMRSQEKLKMNVNQRINGSKDQRIKGRREAERIATRKSDIPVDTIRAGEEECD
jgi:hypothetical protein